jgi:hypothetical protein
MFERIQKVIRFFLRIPSPRLTSEEAIEIAIQEALKLGWHFKQPRAVLHLSYWGVLLVGNIKGSSWISVDTQAGSIIGKGRGLMR